MTIAGLARRTEIRTSMARLRTLTATVTPYGEQLTGIAAGTVLRWSEAKYLPAGDPNDAMRQVAHWHVEAAPLHADVVAILEEMEREGKPLKPWAVTALYQAKTARRQIPKGLLISSAPGAALEFCQQLYAGSIP